MPNEVFAQRPNCISKREICGVFRFHICNWHNIDLSADLVLKELVSVFPTFVHANRCFIGLISRSTRQLHDGH